MIDLSDFFGESSPLKQFLPGFQPRAGQAWMAEAVAEAIAETGKLVVEAGSSEERVTVTVAQAVSTVELSSSDGDGEIAVSETVQFTAVARDANGFVIAGKSAVWATSNAAVLSVLGTGALTADGTGQYS